jgi:N-acetylglucosamine kinase-like BadF-type ATPase
VYNELFRLGRPTIMRDMLFELIGVTRKEDYLETISEGLYNETIDSVAINSIMFNAAELGDAVALGILEESAEQYAGGIARLAMDLDFPEDRLLYVTLGSVFVRQKVKILQDMIAQRVRDTLGERTVEYLQLNAPPVAGAVIWAAQKAGFAIGMPAITKGVSGLVKQQQG